MNYQTLKDGTFDYVQIGEWNNGTLSFFRELQDLAGGPVQSVCSKPCLPGHYKVTTLENIEDICKDNNAQFILRISKLAVKRNDVAGCVFLAKDINI